MDITNVSELYIPSTLDIVEMLDSNEIKDIYKDPSEINNYLTSKLQKKLTGKCNHTGYISDDIHIINRTIGKLKSTHFNGNIYYNIKLKINICIPQKGSHIKCKVLGINNAGVLCETHPFKIILCENIDTTLEDIEIGDELVIEILNYKIVINDKDIKILGKLVSKL